MGRVTLEPPLDGRGARFVVRLPARTPSRPRRLKPRRPPPISGATCPTSLPSSSSSSRSAPRSTPSRSAPVHEIIRFTEPRSVASDVPWIRGVIGLRGKIIPIYDLAARIGLDVERSESAQDRHRRDRHRPGRRDRRRRRGGPDGRRRPARGRPDRRHRTRSSRSPRSSDRLVILLNPEGLLRRAAATSWPRPSRGRWPTRAGHHAQRRVVVADDSRLMRRILSDALGQAGLRRGRPPPPTATRRWPPATSTGPTR